MSAMTGYQTTAAIWFHPEYKSTSLASAAGLTPNPALTIHGGSRIGLSDNEAASLTLTTAMFKIDDNYNSVLDYLAIQNALFNATWHLAVSEITDPSLAGEGPAYSADIPAWAYCTVSQYGNFCAPEDQYGQRYATPPADAPKSPTPMSTWSNLTLNNMTHVLQPPPLDIVWAAPAETWSLVLPDDDVYGGYFTNASIASTAVCQPSAQYQWGFSAVLLFLSCFMTIIFAATMLALESAVWLYSRSSLYQQRWSGYKDAVYVVQALKEKFGKEVVENSPKDIEGKVKSYTGAMGVETEGLGLSRRESGLPARRLFGARLGRKESQTKREIVLLET